MFEFLALILFFMCLIGLVLGLIKPSIVLKSLSKEEQSRKNVLKYFGIGLLVAAFIIGYLNPDTENKDDNNKVVKEEQEENSQEEAKEKEEQEKPVDETETEDISNSQSLIGTTKLKVNLKTAAEYFVEEYEKQRIKGLKINTTAVYSEDIVRDQGGQEFPYSFMIVGRYEERGSRALRDFVMTIGYLDEESYDKGLGSCIQYINEDTGTYINVMNPEDDVILKMLEAVGE